MRYLFFFFILFGLYACSGIDLKNYKNNQPKLDLQAYLNGNIKGYGIIQDRTGNVTRRFNFSGHAIWNNNKGIFDEKIVYSNGKVESREWLFSRVSESEYTATTKDVIGKAVIKLSGNAMNWKYIMDVKVDDNNIYRLNFDDWMFLLDEHHIINQNYFKKFGITVGELTLYMEKEH